MNRTPAIQRAELEIARYTDFQERTGLDYEELMRRLDEAKLIIRDAKKENTLFPNMRIKANLYEYLLDRAAYDLSLGASLLRTGLHPLP